MCSIMFSMEVVAMIVVMVMVVVVAMMQHNSCGSRSRI